MIQYRVTNKYMKKQEWTWGLYDALVIGSGHKCPEGWYDIGIYFYHDGEQAFGMIVSHDGGSRYALECLGQILFFNGINEVHWFLNGLVREWIQPTTRTR